MRHQVSTTARQTQLAALLAAVVAAQDAEVRAALDEVYNDIHSLGGPGLHADNEINRGAALDAIKDVRRRYETD